MLPSLRRLIRPTVILAAAAAAVLPFVGSVLANVGPYTGFGYDISCPQCSGSVTTVSFAGNSFAVIGVTHGRPYTTNGCFADEYAKAPSTRSVYMNLAGPVGKSGRLRRDRSLLEPSGRGPCKGAKLGR
jgi:hypothetical protein